MEIWLKNMAHIESHNFEHSIGRKTYTLRMNHYGDLSTHEFANTYNGFLHEQGKARNFEGGSPYLEHVNDTKPLEDTVDWRDHNLVTDVKDQGKYYLFSQRPKCPQIFFT